VVNKIVRASFFERDPLTCAREVIGTELIWGDCSGIVVEVEAYAAINDEAAHTFTRPSETTPVRLMSILIMECIGC